MMRHGHDSERCVMTPEQARAEAVPFIFSTVIVLSLFRARRLLARQGPGGRGEIVSRNEPQ